MEGRRMPRNSSAARRYAQAFYKLIEKRPDVLLELKAFENVLRSNVGIRAFFDSPLVSIAEKLGAFSDVKKFFPGAAILIETLIEINRVDHLPGIVEEFSRLCDQESGELSVEIESATKLSDSALEDIKTLLSDKWKKRIKIVTKMNPDLLGGFVARAPGRLFDASIVNQIECLQEQVFS